MFQYLPYLQSTWEIQVAPFFADGYLAGLYGGRRHVIEIFGSYARRLSALLHLKRFDVAWIEAELFPWIPWAIEKILAGGRTRVVADYDDAIFHRYDNHQSSSVRYLLGRKIEAFMRHATTVLAGNEYLASYARAAGASRVHLIPTVLDTSRYGASRPTERSAQFTIGWIGTPKTQHYLDIIAEPLRAASRELDARIVAIGGVPSPRGALYETRPWNEATEAAELSAIDVGIMPLLDSPWERGKCGYKLIQYMASGKPVVASPVGVNCRLVEHGENGFLAATPEEWVNAFRFLKADPLRSANMGALGRAKVEREYSLSSVAPRVARILSEAAS